MLEILINAAFGPVSGRLGVFLDRVRETKTPGKPLEQGDGSDERVVSAYAMFDHDATVFGAFEDMADVNRMVTHLKATALLDDGTKRLCKVASMGVASVAALKALNRETPSEAEFPVDGRGKSYYDFAFNGLAVDLKIAGNDSERANCFARAARLAAGYLADRAGVLPEAESEDDATVIVGTHPFMVNRVFKGPEGTQVAYGANEDERVRSAFQMLREVSRDLPADEVETSSVAATLAKAITLGAGPARSEAIATTGAVALRIVAECEPDLTYSIKFPVYRSQEAYDAQFFKIGHELMTAGEDAEIPVLQEVVCLALGYLSDRATPIDPQGEYQLNLERVALAFQRLEEYQPSVDVANLPKIRRALAQDAAALATSSSGGEPNSRLAVEVGAVALKVLTYLGRPRPTVRTFPEKDFGARLLSAASCLSHPELKRTSLIAKAEELVRLAVGFLVVYSDQPQQA